MVRPIHQDAAEMWTKKANHYAYKLIMFLNESTNGLKRAKTDGLNHDDVFLKPKKALRQSIWHDCVGTSGITSLSHHPRGAEYEIMGWVAPFLYLLYMADCVQTKKFHRPRSHIPRFHQADVIPRLHQVVHRSAEASGQLFSCRRGDWLLPSLS